jgi:hypothetical protein
MKLSYLSDKSFSLVGMMRNHRLNGYIDFKPIERQISGGFAYLSKVNEVWGVEANYDHVKCS